MTSDSAIPPLDPAAARGRRGCPRDGLTALVLVLRLDYGFDGWFGGESAIAGGFLGNLAWLLAAPRRRVTRLAVALMGLSVVAWLTFLLFGLPHEVPPVVPNADGSFDFFHGQPFMVAGRSVGTHGSVNAADRILDVMAGPAVFYARAAMAMALSYRFVESVGGSSAVAGLACVLSTAFWLAAGNGLAARLERRRALRHGPRTPG